MPANRWINNKPYFLSVLNEFFPKMWQLFPALELQSKLPHEPENGRERWPCLSLMFSPTLQREIQVLVRTPPSPPGSSSLMPFPYLHSILVEDACENRRHWGVGVPRAPSPPFSTCPIRYALNRETIMYWPEQHVLPLCRPQVLHFQGKEVHLQLHPWRTKSIPYGCKRPLQ